VFKRLRRKGDQLQKGAANSSAQTGDRRQPQQRIDQRLKQINGCDRNIAGRTCTAHQLAQLFSQERFLTWAQLFSQERFLTWARLQRDTCLVTSDHRQSRGLKSPAAANRANAAALGILQTAVRQWMTKSLYVRRVGQHM
jgi:hypothetical protein